MPGAPYPPPGPPSPWLFAPSHRSAPIRARVATTGIVLGVRGGQSILQLVLLQNGEVRVAGSDLLVIEVPSDQRPRGTAMIHPGSQIEAIVSVEIQPRTDGGRAVQCRLERVLTARRIEPARASRRIDLVEDEAVPA